MMHRLRREAVVGEARRVMAVAVAEIRRAPRLVERRPCVDRAGQFAAHQVGVVGETVSGVAIEPAAAIFQMLRQVPVIERHEGRDALLFQTVQEALVEVEPFAIGRACRVHHAWPRNREPIAFETERGQHLDVRFPAMIVIAGNGAGVAGQHLAGYRREGVPDRRQAAVFIHRAFDLIRSGGGAKQEVLAPQRGVRGRGEGIGERALGNCWG